MPTLIPDLGRFVLFTGGSRPRKEETKQSLYV